MAKLTGEQVEQLQNAILSAFTFDELAQVLFVQLNLDLAQISIGDNLKGVVFSLITQAQRTGWMLGLLDAVAKARPQRKELLALLDRLRTVVLAPSEPDAITTEPEPHTHLTDEEFQKVFAGQKKQLQAFRAFLRSQKSVTRIFELFGDGGLGKSWLLRRYRLMCHEHGVIPAQAGIESVRNGYDLLIELKDELETHGLKLPAFDQALAKYRKAQQKVEDGRQMEERPEFSKTKRSGEREILANRYLGEAEERDMFLRPDVSLTDAFLQDLQSDTQANQIVLMFDNYDQIERVHLGIWMRGFIMRLPRNVLGVIATRRPLSAYKWPSDIARYQVELYPMLDSVAKSCFLKHHTRYGAKRVPLSLVNRIVEICDGLPLALHSFAFFASRYSHEEFMAILREVTRDVEESLLKGMPAEFRDGFELCCIPRHFNIPLLAVMLGDDQQAANLYSELAEIPLIDRHNGDGEVHDRMRKWVLRYLQSRQFDRWQSVHQAVLDFYEDEQIALQTEDQLPSREWLHAAEERLYHLAWIHEDRTCRAFLEAYDWANQHDRPDFCGILADVLLEHEGLSRACHEQVRFYRAHALRKRGAWNEAEAELQSLFAEVPRDSELQAYVAYELGRIAHYQSEYDRAIRYYQLSLRLDEKAGHRYFVGKNLHRIGDAYTYRSTQDWSDAIRYLFLARSALEHPEIPTAKRQRGMAEVESKLAIAYRLRGDWHHAREFCKRALPLCQESASVREEARVYDTLAHVHRYQGDWAESSRNAALALQIYRELGNNYWSAVALENQAHLMLLTGDWAGAENACVRARALVHGLDEKVGMRVAGNIAMTEGELWTRRGDTGRAIMCFEESERIFQQLQDRFVSYMVSPSLVIAKLTTNGSEWQDEQETHPASQCFEAMEYFISRRAYFRLLPVIWDLASWELSRERWEYAQNYLRSGLALALKTNCYFDTTRMAVALYKLPTMRENDIKCVLFDLDGTLVDTTDLTVQAYRLAMKELIGDDIPEEEILAENINGPAEMVIRRLLMRRGMASQDLIWSVLEVFRRESEIDRGHHSKILEGVLFTLEELRKRDYILGLITTKPKHLAELSLINHGISHFFDSVKVFQEDTQRHKPDPEPIMKALEIIRESKGVVVGEHEFIYVGDSPSDIVAAQRSGGYTGAALWGLTALREPWRQERIISLLARTPTFLCISSEDLLSVCSGHTWRQAGDTIIKAELARMAEDLADRYKYFDQLALLRLAQGHEHLEAGKLTLMEQTTADSLTNAERKYEEALSYAVLHNGKVLQDVASEIARTCSQRGVVGQKVVRELRRFWQEERNGDTRRKWVDLEQEANERAGIQPKSGVLDILGTEIWRRPRGRQRRS
jgi:pyrophosphatase PpaX